jgi:adenylate cyclase
MGQIHLTEVRQGLSKSPQKSIDQAFELAQKALSLDELHPGVHTLLAWVYLDKGQYEKGIEACERAVALYPNHNHSLFFLGIALSVSDRPHEAIPYFERALRLNPLDPTPSLYGLGDTYRVMGRYEEAIPKLEKALALKPKYFPALLNLAACYSSVGREQEAHAIVEQLLKLNPNFSLERFAKTMLHRGAVKERYLAALRKAGVPETPPLPLPDKPSIAVLPFVNMSGDPEQEYFSDGISEEIITGLSKTSNLFVIARTSSFKYKGKQVDVRAVGRELGVHNVLEGSVRKAGDKVRITAQLIDAKTNKHLWAERYDRDLKDIFAIQDEVTKKIITAMQVELTEGEQIRIWAKGTENYKAYLKYLESRKYSSHFNKESIARARRLADEAIALDPEYALAYGQLGFTHWADLIMNWSESRAESFKKFIKLVEKGLALDDSLPSLHALQSQIYLMKKQYDQAASEAEKAVSLSPSYADAYVNLAFILRCLGKPEEAIVVVKKAIRLNPFPSVGYYHNLATSYLFVGMPGDALEAYKKAIKIEPDNLSVNIGLAVTYSSLGQEEDARAVAANILKIDPKFSVEGFAKKLPYKNKAYSDILIGGLQKVGLK